MTMAESTETTTPETQSDKSYSKAELDAALKKAQKDWDKQVKDAEAKAKLSEEERTKAEMAELRNQIRERDARDAVRTEAARLNVKNPQMVYRLVKDELEFSDDGKVSNLKDVIDSAKLEFPEIFDNKPTETIDGGRKDNGNATPEDQTAANFKKTGRSNSFRL